MPCPDGTGKCCYPTSTSAGPRLYCRDCVSEDLCQMWGDGGWRDCREDLTAVVEGLTGSQYVEIRTDDGNNRRVMNVSRENLSWVLANVMATEGETDRYWSGGVSCYDPDAYDENDHWVPCGLGAACCISKCYPGYDLPSDYGDCRILRGDVCGRTYWIQPVAIWLGNLPGSTLLWPRCRARLPLNNRSDPTCYPVQWYNLQDANGDPVQATSYSGDKICSCQSTVPPYISPDFVDLGYTDCIRRIGDQREWQDACTFPPIDDLPCFTIGFPVVFDTEGHATFYGGYRKVTTDIDGCKHVLSDPYIDDSGYTHSVACVELNPVGGGVRTVAVGDPYVGECVAMYHDIRFDDAYDCFNN